MEQDHRKAFQLFQASARQGNAAGRCNLALYYMEGKVVQPNHTEAFRLMELAAEQDYAFAVTNVGVFYAAGIGKSAWGF